MPSSLNLKPTVAKTLLVGRTLLIGRTLLVAKGALMGLADLVPGVSGGTIALLVGVYPQLLRSLTSAFALLAGLLRQAQRGLKARLLSTFLLRSLFQPSQSPTATSAPWQASLQQKFSAVNFPFLLPLFAGLAFSLIAFSRLIKHLLQHHFVLLFSVFFGLVLATIVSLTLQLAPHLKRNQSSARAWLNLLLFYFSGLAAGFFLSTLSPAAIPTAASEGSLLAFFFAGSVAICAMILPGISGSFILLLLNRYEALLTAIKQFDYAVLLAFSAGCLVGLGLFSRFLNWCLARYWTAVLALMTGFMLGALPKLWPWKSAAADQTASSLSPLLQENVSPFAYEILSQADNQLGPAMLLMLAAAVTVFTLHRYAQKKEQAAPTA